MNKKIKDKKVSEIMKTDLITATEDMTIKDLKALFDRYDYNAFPVVRGKAMVGIVTKMDLFKTFSTGMRLTRSGYFNLWANKVGDIMRRSVVFVHPDDSISKVIDYMVEFKLRSVPVIKGKELVGIVSRSDLVPHMVVEEE
ncbi:MAG: CBS domain-containing protein [Methanomassiliicoccales archaeon]|nr:MAG: CBS domain-containing protein [Methanomassiliicoccales archaeon]